MDKLANSPAPALPRTDRAHIMQFMKLISDMPRAKADATTGMVKIENMVEHLGHLPRPCLEWMRRQVHVRFDWMPTIKQLLDLASEWKRDDEPLRVRIKAAVIARNERQSRLNEQRNALRSGVVSQDWVDALPERNAAILETEGLLYACRDCGSFTQRQSAIVQKIDDPLAIAGAVQRAQRAETGERSAA